MTVAMIVAMLLAFAFLVLGMLSNGVAQVYPSPPSAAQTPEMPSDLNMPRQNIPGQNVPGGLPMAPGRVEPVSRGGSLSCDDLFASAGARDGGLGVFAQTQPGASVPTLQPPSSAPTSSSTAPAAKKKQDTGPPKQTSGIGKIANVANGAGARGFQIYMLVLFVALAVVFYLAMSRARREGKAK